jgi:hypothetical protein
MISTARIFFENPVLFFINLLRQNMKAGKLKKIDELL